MENLTLIFAVLLPQPGLLMLNEKINAARSHFSTDFLHFQPRWSQICNAKPKFRAQSAITTACRILHDVYLLQLQNLNTKNKSSQSPLLFMLLDCCRHMKQNILKKTVFRQNCEYYHSAMPVVQWSAKSDYHSGSSVAQWLASPIWIFNKVRPVCALLPVSRLLGLDRRTVLHNFPFQLPSKLWIGNRASNALSPL